MFVRLSSPCHIVVFLERRASRNFSSLESNRNDLTNVSDFAASAVDAVSSSFWMLEIVLIEVKSVRTTAPCTSKDDKMSSKGLSYGSVTGSVPTVAEDMFNCNITDSKCYHSVINFKPLEASCKRDAGFGCHSM